MGPESVQAGRWTLTLATDQATGLVLATAADQDGHVERVRVLTQDQADHAREHLAEEVRRAEVYGGTVRWEDLLGE